MFMNVIFALNLLFISPVHSKHLPSIVQVITTRELVIAFVEVEAQIQVLVVHVSVIFASISYEPTH